MDIVGCHGKWKLRCHIDELMDSNTKAIETYIRQKLYNIYIYIYIIALQIGLHGWILPTRERGKG